jgi:CRP/FNR family transcriptional regulator, cyclic AMP receptor protein
VPRPVAVPIPQGHDSVSLCAADTEIGALIPSDRRREAESELTVRASRLAAGPWDVSSYAAVGAEQVGLLILDGVIWREVGLGGRLSAELLGPGDILRPWQFDDRDGLLPVAHAYTVLVPATLAVIDRRFATTVLPRWPQVMTLLLERQTDRAFRLATAQAISQLTRVDRRIAALLWHLAERWGRVSGDGVVVPLPLTHRMLGELVGARRPTVSTALAQLVDRGELSRRRDGTWLLRGAPQAAADPPPATSLHGDAAPPEGGMTFMQAAPG